MTFIPHAFFSTMHKHGLPNKDRGILVAFSGGADSVALLHMVWVFTHKNRSESKQYNVPVLAFHVHHGIRGEEADRDADFCRRFCQRHGIPFAVEYVDAPRLAASEHLTLEEAARKARYTAICAYLEKHPSYTHVLTAHHSDDQAETVLFRWLRGSGAKGLSGIAEVRELTLANGAKTMLLRPLLGLSKNDLLVYCEENRLPFVFDSTNCENDATRNCIRNVILPQIQKINPAFTNALLRTSQLQAADDKYLSAEANKTYQALPQKHGGYALSDLQGLDDAILTRIISMWFTDTANALTGAYDAAYQAPLTAEHLLSAASNIRCGENTTVSFPRTLSLSIDKAAGLVRLSATQNSVLQVETVLQYGKVTALANGASILLLEKENFLSEPYHHLQNIYKFVISTTINSATIVGSLFLRPRKDSATDVYLCGGSHKKVKDVLSSHKVPLHLRGDVPLICDERGIVWVPFCGIRDDVNPKADKNCTPSFIYYFYNDV